MNQTAGRMNDRALAWFLLILLSLIWGSSFILIKRGLAIYSPLELGAIRIVTAGLVLLPVSLSRIGKLPKRSWRVLLLAGFLGSLGPAFLFALAPFPFLGALILYRVAGRSIKRSGFFRLCCGYCRCCRRRLGRFRCRFQSLILLGLGSRGGHQTTTHTLSSRRW